MTRYLIAFLKRDGSCEAEFVKGTKNAAILYATGDGRHLNYDRIGFELYEVSEPVYAVYAESKQVADVSL